MDGSQAIAAGAALSVFSYGAQHDRLIRMAFPRGDGPDRILLPNRLKVREEVSRCFRVEVELLSDDARIPLKAMMARMVTISVVREDGSLRYFNGYVTEFRFLRADGGFAFYRMVLEPWLAFTRLRKDNVAFHGKSVIELTELTFAHYHQADWQPYLVDEFPRMTCANQYDETDYNHLHRRWEASGLMYHYEHRADGHTLWLYDRSDLVRPVDPTGIDDSGEIPFRDKAGSLEDDGIREWSPVRRIGAGQTTLASFDYKNPIVLRSTAESFNDQGDVDPYEIYENTGSYGFRTRAEGEKLAYRRMGERDANTQYFDARGNDRTAQPGRFFKLGGHFSAELQAPKRGEPAKPSIRYRHYLILSVDHEASNNYQAGPGAPSHYENTFRCVRKDIPWRPGPNYNSQPCTYPGIQTAIVVGAAGSEIHTDGYGRVKVQFHWDRLGKYDENSSPWLRVMSPGAGSRFGDIRLPRVGEEVAVVFLDANIDHPVILGALYNYTHMPPWQLPEQQALSGLRSRELQGGEGSRRGNHLILDDTTGKIQAQLKSDHQCSQLSLGHITRIEDTSGRKDPRGEGWELRTDGHGALRSGEGMLVTTERRTQGQSHITDMKETLQRLGEGHLLHEKQAKNAIRFQAQEWGQQDDVADTVQRQNDTLTGRTGKFPEFEEPHLLLASAAGIAISTAQTTHMFSEQHIALTAKQDISFVAGDSFLASIKKTFRLFVEKAGMKLIAASGKITIQAKQNEIELIAAKVMSIISDEDWINLKSKKGIRLHGAGSVLEISDKVQFFTTSPTLFHGNLETLAPGAPPNSEPVPGQSLEPNLSSHEHPFDEQFRLTAADGHTPISNRSYRIVADNGQIWEGRSDDEGFTQRVTTKSSVKISLFLLPD